MWTTPRCNGAAGGRTLPERPWEGGKPGSRVWRLWPPTMSGRSGYFAPARRLPEAPLIEHWNGRSWSLQPTHALTRLKAVLPQSLASVAALAPDDVWVLGHGVRGAGPFDVLLHWNGATWKLFPGPNLISPRPGSAWMQALGTDHRGRVWAVGRWVRGQGEAGVPAGGIVERRNGRQWEVDRHSAWRKPLTIVAPVAPGDVWAITGGSFAIAGGGYGVSPVQVLHWNERSWRAELSLAWHPMAEPAPRAGRAHATARLHWPDCHLRRLDRRAGYRGRDRSC